SVGQGRFEALALPRDTVVSPYPRAAREVRFRFSINGAENECRPGTEHTIYLRPRNGKLVTRLYRFGDETEPPPPTPEESAASEDGTAQVTFRVDLRRVLDAIGDRGGYDPPLGARIAHVDHVYVVGAAAGCDLSHVARGADAAHPNRWRALGRSEVARRVDA